MLSDKDPSNQYPDYDTKQHDGKVQLILELKGIQKTSLLP